MNKQIFNPFLPEGTYIPDGEPHVFGDRVYLFGSHDQEGGDSFCMLDYEGWSAPVNNLSAWESAGIIYSAKQDPMYSEKRPYMYAPDVVQGNDGRFYLYYCLAGWKGESGYDGPISVAVNDAPNGKYEYLGFVRNPDGTPFDDCVVFDPALINDDGVIRLYCGTNLYWGMEIKKWNQFLLAPMASATYHRPKEQFTAKHNPLGAFTVELADDMLTVKSKAKKILPLPTRKNRFKGHSFYEGASIRKVGDTYYFIYSSEKNHELCYATSKFPDREFSYGGTIVSTGDVGMNGRKDKDRLNVTGTTHGSIECIAGQWYVFYHRLSHGSDYSRQACAEPITIAPDGSIQQVEVSSCGLNNAPLNPDGIIPSTKACVLSNGKMPHVSNKKWDKPIPMVTHQGKEHYITNFANGCFAGFKWFVFSGEPIHLSVTIRGTAIGKLGFYADNTFEKPIGSISVKGSSDWVTVNTDICPTKGILPLYVRYEGEGVMELLQVSFMDT